MLITRENQNKINELIGTIETPFNTNQVYNCRKGSCQKIKFVSDSNISAKGKKENLIKLEVAVVRVGVKYANLGINQNEEFRNATHEIKGRWLDNGYYIENNDVVRLRVYNATLPNIKTKVYYLLNGEVKTKEWCIENKYIYDRTNYQKPPCYDIKVENILEFGK